MKHASTYRLREDVQAGLELISQLQHRPKNKLVNEAVAEYISRHAVQTELLLQETLRNLRSYQQSDPDFSQAIEGFVEAEAQMGPQQDTVEGKQTPSAGPIAESIRNLINA
jgi:hypothetical protein